MVKLKKAKFPVKDQDIVRLRPQQLKLNKNCTDSDKEFFKSLKFYYYHRYTKKIKLEGIKYDIIEMNEISVPGLITDHISALYKNEISLSTLKLFKDNKPEAILYIYNGFKPVVLESNSNPAGLVQLLFIRYLLKRKKNGKNE